MKKRWAYGKLRVYADTREEAADRLRGMKSPLTFFLTDEGDLRELPLDDEPVERFDGRAAPGA